jgi:hypothetical protein
MEAWTREAAADWLARQPWLCGFNYLPRTAVNWIDQWQAETFDEATIAQELGWAAGIGFNTLRTNLHSLVWAADPAGLRARIDRFLGIAARHGIATMLCLFDDCGFSGEEPRLGPQGDPLPGVHNGRACASPGREVVRNRAEWDRLEGYVADVVGHFAEDSRVLAWDLYNEPGNDSVIRPGGGTPTTDALIPFSFDLAVQTFTWARAARPTQPLTTGVWHPAWPDVNARLIELSDVVSFHNYFNLETVRAQVENLEKHGRPLLCTEWLARSLGSRVATHLPYFAGKKIGCYHWGLVNGRTQTHLIWNGLEQLVQAGEWHHDLLHPDGTPYDAEEVALFERMRSASADRR